MKRQFTKEFKEQAVRLVREQKMTIAQVAKDLDIGESCLGKWVHASTHSNQLLSALSSDENQELKRLRKENHELRMEREILKKATAYFAKHLS